MTPHQAVNLIVAQRNKPDGGDRTAVRGMVRRNTRHLNIPPTATVRNSDRGAPHLTGSSLHISLTHDRYWMAAATSAERLGIDIQQVEPCSEGFRRRLSSSTDAGASRSWCVREAISKLRGRGLMDAPWRYEIHGTDIAESGRYKETHWICLTLRHNVFLAVATVRPAVLNIEEDPYDSFGHRHQSREYDIPRRHRVVKV